MGPMLRAEGLWKMTFIESDMRLILSLPNHYSTNRRFVVRSVEWERLFVFSTHFMPAGSAGLLPLVNCNTGDDQMQSMEAAAPLPYPPPIGWGEGAEFWGRVDPGRRSCLACPGLLSGHPSGIQKGVG
jgi:hypothetical protein